MPAEDGRRRWNRNAILVVGPIVGVFLGVGLVFARLFVPLDTATAGLLGASPGNTLQVIQSVGILLPLFTGLLRFTTSGHSGVNDQVNDYLLFGIVGLVLAGMSATIAGTLTAMKGILKLSLLFILFTFVVIGLAAVAMFGELASDAGDNETATKETETDAETRDNEPEHAGSGDAKRDVDPEAEAESEPESNEEVEHAETPTEE